MGALPNKNGHSHVTPVAPVIVIFRVAVDFAMFNYITMVNKKKI